MTRDDFDRLYACRLDNTEGYTQRQLDIINAITFGGVDFALERASTNWLLFD
jgi:hypothetical protein